MVVTVVAVSQIILQFMGRLLLRGLLVLCVFLPVEGGGGFFVRCRCYFILNMARPLLCLHSFINRV